MTNDRHSSRRDDLEKIRSLVGDISEAQLGHTDYAVTERMELFMPIIRPCGYAVTPNHTHPSYSFIFAFDNCAQMRIDGQVLASKEGSRPANNRGRVATSLFFLK